MAKQTFTTGQVLTAAQMTSLQQTAMGGGSTTAKTASYTLVAADAGTVVQMNSASATTITVNTALFAAGDTVQIQNVGAGVCTVTAGTATVTTAGSLALSQYEGGQLYFNTTSAALFLDYVQSGGTAGTWVAYTPTLTGWTLGNGTLVGFYNNDGKTVNVAASIKWGSTTSAAGNLYLSLPVAADLTLGGAFLFNIYQGGGVGVATDFNADTYYQLGAYVTNTTTMRIILTNGASNSGVAVSIPFTWATSDMMIISITYKAA